MIQYTTMVTMSTAMNRTTLADYEIDKNSSLLAKVTTYVDSIVLGCHVA